LMSHFGKNPSATTAYVTVPTNQIVKPLEYDSGNTDIALNTPTPIIGLVPIKIKPQSLVHDPWTGFGPFENRLFIDDFCHEKELTVKVQAATFNGGTIKIK